MFLMQHYSDAAPINVGCGEDLSIHDLAATIAHIVGFHGHFEFDSTRPDGTPRKVLDTSRISALGWRPRIALEAGIESTWNWYREQSAQT
jgi:GDP-L-fucose synthase